MLLKKTAVINDLSGFGKCSLTAAIPVISALGVQCCPLPTAILSNQTGYESYRCCDFTDEMQNFANEWKKLNASFDGILTGFISNSRQGEIIERFIKDFKSDNCLLLVDPVMADDGMIYDCYDEKSVEAIKRLAEMADIITPNITELAVLCGCEYEEISGLEYPLKLKKVKELSEFLSKKNGSVIITTGIKSDSEISTSVYNKGNFSVYTCPALGGSFSGTGDILSAFVLASCVGGATPERAVERAVDFIHKSIEATISENDESYQLANGINFEKYLYTLRGNNNEKE